MPLAGKTRSSCHVCVFGPRSWSVKSFHQSWCQQRLCRLWGAKHQERCWFNLALPPRPGQECRIRIKFQKSKQMQASRIQLQDNKLMICKETHLINTRTLWFLVQICNSRKVPGDSGRVWNHSLIRYKLMPVKEVLCRQLSVIKLWNISQVTLCCCHRVKT